MKRSGKTLGDISSRFFAFVQLKGKETIRTGELIPVLNLSPTQEQNLFHHLSDFGMIVRLKRGVYFIPNRLPGGGR